MKSTDDDKRLIYIVQTNCNMCFYGRARGRCKKTTRYCAMVALHPKAVIYSSLGQSVKPVWLLLGEAKKKTYKGKMSRIVEKTSQNEMTNLLIVIFIWI